MMEEECLSVKDGNWLSSRKASYSFSGKNNAKAFIDRISSGWAVFFSIFAFAAVTTNASACEGQSPTRFYMQEVAPTLPPDQRNPFHMEVVERPNIGRGDINVSKLAGLSDSNLECWFALGDRIAAYTLHAREFKVTRESLVSPLPLDRPEFRRMLSLLLVATRSCTSCSEEFGREPLLSAMFSLAWIMESTKLAPKWARELYSEAAQAGHWQSWYVVNNVSEPVKILDIDWGLENAYAQYHNSAGKRRAVSGANCAIHAELERAIRPAQSTALSACVIHRREAIGGMRRRVGMPMIFGFASDNGMIENYT